MDASDKIIRFNSLEDLETAIQQDLTTRDIMAQRYCVRFIMLNNFEEFRKLSSFLRKELKVGNLDLEQLTFGDDTTLTMDMLSNAVRNVQETTLVTPFSEVVRFFKEEDFKGFFNDIILTEDILNPRKRIYIPVIGLNNRFIDFLKSFGRINESAPIWQYYTPSDDKVTVYVSKLGNIKTEGLDICQLSTMREWLSFWKKQAPQAKILCGAKPIISGHKYSRPDSIFSFIEIRNAYQFLTELKGFSLPISYNEKDEPYWSKIVEATRGLKEKSFSFKAFVLNHFNRRELNLEEAIELMADSNNAAYERWLLKNYIFECKLTDEKSYVSLCLSETTDLSMPERLFVDIAERIFYLSEAELLRFYEQRKSLMQTHRELFRALVPQSNQEWIKNKLIEFAQFDSTLGKVKKLCTATYDFEKELFTGWFVNRHDDNFGSKDLKAFYPDLLGYLMPFNESGVSNGKDWMRRYFDDYRQAKLLDSFTPEVSNLIAAVNEDDEAFFDWYHSVSESHSVLGDIKSDEMLEPTKIYWVDGLGAEFIPYIHYLVEKAQSNYEIVHSQLTRTTIPSNTHLNSYDVDNHRLFKIGDLDELAHDGHYKRYSTLIRELDVVKRIVNKILNDNKIGSHTIAIVSDHGLSALSRLVDSNKIESKTKHEGRYAPIEEGSLTVSDKDFIVTHNDRDGKKYKVALKHASLGTKPTHEVHGGCTPEEVLVPFIVLSNNPSAKPVEYKIMLKDDKIPVSDPQLSITIMPQPESVEISMDGKTPIKLLSQGTQWTTNLQGAIEGKHKISIHPKRGKAQHFEIEVYGMGFNNTDDDFDF